MNEMEGLKGCQKIKEHKDGMTKEWEQKEYNMWDKMSMNNSRCKKEKDHRKSSTLHHMVSSHSNDEGNILRTHFEQSEEGFVNSPNFYKWKFWTRKRVHWARCYQLPLLMLHFNRLDKQRTRVAPPSEASPH
jgi:hypothetical protein